MREKMENNLLKFFPTRKFTRFLLIRIKRIREVADFDRVFGLK